MTRDPIDELAALPPPTPPPLPPRLEAELGSLQPIGTRRPLRQLAMLCAASLLYGAGVLAVVTTRRDAGELPIGWMIGAGVAWLCGFVIPCYLATVPRAGSVIPRWRLAAIAAVVTTIAFMLLGLAIHPTGPSSVRTKVVPRPGRCIAAPGGRLGGIPCSRGAVWPSLAFGTRRTPP